MTVPSQLAVSPNNPCPMLRAMVALGYLPDTGGPIDTVSDALTKAKTGSAGGDPKFHRQVSTVALVANGLWLGDLFRNSKNGVRFDRLRGGPLDKKGAGSRILDAQANVVETELARLSEFASPKTGSNGDTESGLSTDEIVKLMDANFARAKGFRRVIDRKLMDGEFPILLQLMGKSSASGPYLSLAEVRTLFAERQLPERVRARLDEAE